MAFFGQTRVQEEVVASKPQETELTAHDAGLCSHAAIATSLATTNLRSLRLCSLSSPKALVRDSHRHPGHNVVTKCRPVIVVERRHLDTAATCRLTVMACACALRAGKHPSAAASHLVRTLHPRFRHELPDARWLWRPRKWATGNQQRL